MQNFLQNQEWARNPIFDHFWRHYAVCEQWKQQHSDALRQVHFQGVSEAEGRVEDVEVTDRLSRCEIREEIGDFEPEIEEPGESEEISQEVRDFFAKTQEHRRNLAEKRAAEEREKPWLQASGEEYVDVDKITVRGRVEHTAEHRNANAEFAEKRANAQKMYGIDAAARILALESQLEMRFEEEYAKCPQLWPNIPFRF